MSLSISLFGRVEIYDGSEDHIEQTTTRAQELLAYVLLNRGRAVPREKLASMLWGRVRKDSSLAYLRKALWKLRKTLERDGEPFLLRVDREWIEVDSEADFWLDVAEFERAFEDVRDTPVRDLGSEEVIQMKRCAGLYTGDLLENWYHDWCALERSRLQNFYLILLDRLGDYCEIESAYDAGMQWVLRALQVDPARECSHRRLMRLRYLAGDRTGAIRQYRRCAQVLDDQLDVAPTSKTERLRRRIRRDEEIPHRSAHSTEGALPGDGDARSTELDQLRALERTLSHLREQVRSRLDGSDVSSSSGSG